LSFGVLGHCTGWV